MAGKNDSVGESTSLVTGHDEIYPTRNSTGEDAHRTEVVESRIPVFRPKRQGVHNLQITVYQYELRILFRVKFYVTHGFVLRGDARIRKFSSSRGITCTSSKERS